jgi:hypothetical protein
MLMTPLHTSAIAEMPKVMDAAEVASVLSTALPEYQFASGLPSPSKAYNLDASKVGGAGLLPLQVWKLTGSHANRSSYASK